MNDRQRRLADRVGPQIRATGEPSGIVPALTPWPAWALIVSMVIFLPGALLLSFFVRRHVIVRVGDELIGWRVSFWRMQPIEQTFAVAVSAAARNGGSGIDIGEDRYHVEPGWAIEIGEMLGA